MLVKSVHKCSLRKFKSADGNTVKEEEEENKIKHKPNDDLDLEEYYDEDYDEDKWQCNGVVYFPEGCKSNQLGFDYHEGVEGYHCPDRDTCDFDLCDMCIRWIIHCEKKQDNLNVARSCRRRRGGRLGQQRRSQCCW